MNPSQENNNPTEILSNLPQDKITIVPTPVYDSLRVEFAPLTEEELAFEDELEAGSHPNRESVLASMRKEAMPQMLDKNAWHEKLARDMQIANAKGLPMSVSFIDVNYFKEVNDLISHERGDQVIEELKVVITGVFRTSPFVGVQESERLNRGADILSLGATQVAEDLIGDVSHIDGDAGHIGGDEFGIYTFTGAKEMELITKRVRDAFKIYIDLPQNEDLRKLGMFESGIGLAIGSATFEPGMTASELLTKADNAMYADKIEQIPNLTEKQKASIWAAKVLLKEAGIRLRDLAKLDVLLGVEEFMPDEPTRTDRA